MTSPHPDIAIIGGGILGLATALALTRRGHANLVILEAEERVAAHQTGHNSGVIHSGLYYKPGSLKAKNCVEGREDMYRFCAEHGIAHDRCGKVVVAVSADELPALEELERRGHANGLQGLKRLDAAGLREHEPHVAGIAGLLVPETGIVDYVQVTEKYAELVRAAGGDIRLGHRLIGCRRDGDAFVLETLNGEIRARWLINCGGLQCDRVARLCGARFDLQIIPFRGEYYELVPEKHGLVKNLIYPVPDPRFPFLGVHFTRMIHGGVEAGPNAVLALRREGYSRWDVSCRDLVQLAVFPGFWRMAFKHWKTGLEEVRRSFSKTSFCAALQRLVPELKIDDLKAAGSGVRAQAVEPDGKLVDDFRFVEGERMVHVLNAPSPGATASLSIGRTIADLALTNFGLEARKES
ncbi:MAG: L-2-hydroxyglutarate oxidase [Gemmataceae bacterium]